MSGAEGEESAKPAATAAAAAEGNATSAPASTFEGNEAISDPVEEAIRVKQSESQSRAMPGQEERSGGNSGSEAEGFGWAKSEAFFFNHGSNIAFFTIMIAANIIMGAWAIADFTPPQFTTDSDILRVTLPIARLGGRLVTWNVAVILVTGCKYLWTWLRSTPLAFGFPINNVMPFYHRVIALTIIIMGCIVHTIPQIINYATEALVIESNGVWTFGNGMATKQLLITGSLLVAVFGSFFVTTLERVRRTTAGFRIFWITHIAGIFLSMPLLIIHGTMRGYPMTVYFIAGPVVLYAVDFCLRRYFVAKMKAKVMHLSAHEDGDERITQLIVRNKAFVYSPGQYAELKIPQLSRMEHHPFTIASPPNKEGDVEFFIKDAGRWTGALYELATRSHTGDNRYANGTPVIDTVQIRGPFGAPAQNYDLYNHIVVIGSGIGVTPLLSIWEHLAQNAAPVEDGDAGSNVAATSIFEQEDIPASPRHLLDAESERIILDESTLGHVDVVAMKDLHLSSRRAQFAYYASILESMTVNMFLFCFFVLIETASFCTWSLASKYSDRVQSIVQMASSGFGLLVFGNKVLLSLLAYRQRYVVSFVFLLEFALVCLDSSALGVSIADYFRPERSRSTSHWILGFLIIVQSTRIFYIFYATARPPRQHPQKPRKRKRKSAMEGDQHFESVVGVWVSRNYSAMSFAAPDLVASVRDLPPSFSLQLYATRDKASDVAETDPFLGCGSQHSLHAGRPDWEQLLTEAIHRAHSTNPHGEETVGIFFCGSPAIAATLQTVALQVTAKHSHSSGGECKCRIHVHKENF